MSFITDARRWSRNLSDKVNILSHKLAQYTTDQSIEEGEDVIIKTEGRLAEDVIKYCDDKLPFSGLMTLLPCYPPEEPDGDKLRLLISGEEFGPTIPDVSGFGHHFTNRGVMRIQKGIDYGNGGSYELVFDGRSTYPFMPHHSDFNISNLTVGFSILFRYMPFRLDQTGGVNQTIFVKKEDDNNRFGFDILPDGRLLFVCKHLNVFYDVVTPLDTIEANYAPRYEIVATFDVPTTTAKLYVNNVEYTTIDNGITVNQPGSTEFRLGSNHALVTPPAGQEYPEIADSKLYCGSLQMLKFWREKVLTSTEISNHYTNKLTISNIAYGEVAYPGLAFATS